MDTRKKWSSFEEMYSDLKKDPGFGHLIKKPQAEEISKIIKDIELAKTSQDFFTSTCKLSSIFESLDSKILSELYTNTNVYVLVLNASLRNPVLTEVILELASQDKNISELQKDKIMLDKLVLLNSILSLAFFGIAINYRSISRVSIEFLRKNVTDIIKVILRQTSKKKLSFINICYFLEGVAWDNRLHFNVNYSSKFPLKLDDKFLFKNLSSSRSFAGITFTSLIIRPIIELSLRRVISDFNNEKFSISFALDSIFNISNNLDERIRHYYRKAPQDITSFFDIFIKKNEKNLIFCLKEFCHGFQYQGKDKKFFEIILEKLKDAENLKRKLVSYLHSNFTVYNKQIEYGDDEWTHKLFLISIKSSALLEEINKAKDQRWSVGAAVFELRKWVIEIHEVLNKYYIEDDWEKVEDLLIQENEIIEWKSSFFTPLEQEYLSKEADLNISKKLFQRVLKVILAMLNTDGGVLLIGVVENPASVKRLHLKDFLLVKNGLTFFDINKELKDNGKTLDNIRLQILDNLKQITDTSADSFNGLFELEPIALRNDEQVISIIKITIRKANKPFFNVKKEAGLVWLSMTKRAQGQNVDVDIREHL